MGTAWFYEQIRSTFLLIASPVTRDEFDGQPLQLTPVPLRFRVEPSYGPRYRPLRVGRFRRLQVRTSGGNAYGQLGHKDTKTRYTFTAVRALESKRVRAINVGEDHSAAVAADATVYLWGRGDWGQLGVEDGRTHWGPVPLDAVAVPGVTVQPNPLGRLLLS
eukprot:2110447-Pyramimonas_sp.AAC.3